MTNNIALWYAARATGMVALLLMTATVIGGILGVTRVNPRTWPRFTLILLHRNLSLLTAVFLVVHVASSTVDAYAGIGWLDALVPFGSVYKPFWLGLGAIALDLLIALVITSLVRPHINLRLWRAVHWMAYLGWPVALVHALGTGTDTRHGWSVTLPLGCLAAAGAAFVWRLSRSAVGQAA